FGDARCLVEQRLLLLAIVALRDRHVVRGEQIVPALRHREQEREPFEGPIGAWVELEDPLQDRKDVRRIFEPLVVKCDGATAERASNIGGKIASECFAVEQRDVIREIRFTRDLVELVPCLLVAWVLAYPLEWCSRAFRQRRVYRLARGNAL